MSDSQRVKFFPLGANAIGRIQARDDQTERLEEFTTRVGSGEFHVMVDATVPSGCIDGRPGCSLKPNAAGGTNTLAAAVDLTNDIDTGYLASYDHVLEKLRSAGLPIGGHDDVHASDAVSGCGACDKLSEIYMYIVKHSTALRESLMKLGYSISNVTHQRIIANATARTDFPSGSDIKKSLVRTQYGTVDHLRGEHNEVLAVINSKPQTTLDRDALETEFSVKYEAFNIDVWSFRAAAQHIASSGDDANEMVHAMLYYNLATANVLCGPNMRVIVLQ